MKKATYTDNVTRFMTIRQGCDRYKLGRGLFLRVAEEAGAVRCIGRRKIFDASAIDAFIDRQGGTK